MIYLVKVVLAIIDGVSVLKSKLRISTVAASSDPIDLTKRKAVELLTEDGVITIYWKGNEKSTPAGVTASDEPWITEVELEKHVGLTSQYLRQLRFQNEGPPYLRKGNAILYRLSMVRKWMTEQKEQSILLLD